MTITQKLKTWTLNNFVCWLLLVGSTTFVKINFFFLVVPKNFEGLPLWCFLGRKIFCLGIWWNFVHRCTFWWRSFHHKIHFLSGDKQTFYTIFLNCVIAQKKSCSYQVTQKRWIVGHIKIIICKVWRESGQAFQRYCITNVVFASKKNIPKP
jgi:hypothetical protein